MSSRLKSASCDCRSDFTEVFVVSGFGVWSCGGVS